MSLRIGSLCSGYGGLDAAVREVFGGELAFVADNDPGAAKILAHRLPSVPNLGDITQVDWSDVEPVDIVCAGWPCPPVSAAGKRKGIHDERWLWDDIAAALGRMGTRPRLLVFENVAGLLTANGGGAMARVVHALGALGYVGRYRLLRASDAGAPHRRERVFIVAWLAADTANGGRHELDDGREPRAHGPESLGGHAGLAGNDRGGHIPAADAYGRTECPRPVEAGRRLVASIQGNPQSGRRRNGQHPDAPHPNGATGGERRLPAPGEAESWRPRADAGGRGGAPAADAYGTGEGWPEQPSLRLQPGRRPAGSGEVLADTMGGAGRLGDGDDVQPRWPPGRHEPATGRGAPAYAWCGGRRGDESDERRGTLQRTLADGDSAPSVAWGPYEPAIRRWERVLGRSAPRPTEPGRTGERLSPKFVEFLMGLPDGWVTDVPGLSRNAQLKALGNGVVPQQAVMALRLLLSSLPELHAAKEAV